MGTGEESEQFERPYEKSYVISHADILVLEGELNFVNFQIWSFSF